MSRLSTQTAIPSSPRPAAAGQKRTDAGDRLPLEPRSRRQLWVLSLAHVTVDMFGTFASPLWPLLMPKLGLTAAGVGYITSLSGILGAPIQPLAGHMVDRTPGLGRMMLWGGTALAVLCLSLIGTTTSVWVFLSLLLFGKIGMQLFHPAAARLVAAATFGTGHTGLAMSSFSFFGNVGMAVGPILITAVVALVSLEGMGSVIIPLGLAVAFMLYRVTRAPAALPPAKTASPAALEQSGPAAAAPAVTAKPSANIQQGAVWTERVPALSMLALIMTLRASAWIALVNFLPIYLVDRGVSIFAGGVSLSAFTLCGALGGLAGGYLSDRAGRRPVVAGSLLLGAAGIQVFLFMDGFLFYLALMATGALIVASHPIGVVLAQEYAPGSMGMVSGVMMGLVFALGAGLMAPVGVLADAIGVAGALRTLSLLLLASAALSLFLPDPKRVLPPVTEA